MWKGDTMERKAYEDLKKQKQQPTQHKGQAREGVLTTESPQVNKVHNIVQQHVQLYKQDQDEAKQRKKAR